MLGSFLSRIYVKENIPNDVDSCPTCYGEGAIEEEVLNGFFFSTVAHYMESVSCISKRLLLSIDLVLSRSTVELPLNILFYILIEKRKKYYLLIKS